MDTAQKTRENRLRQAAKRQRMTLVRSSRRDPLAWDYGRYWLVAPHLGTVIGAEDGGASRAGGPPGRTPASRAGGPPGLTLDEVERHLTTPRPAARRPAQPGQPVASSGLVIQPGPGRRAAGSALSAVPVGDGQPGRLVIGERPARRRSAGAELRLSSTGRPVWDDGGDHRQ